MRRLALLPAAVAVAFVARLRDIGDPVDIGDRLEET